MRCFIHSDALFYSWVDTGSGQIERGLQYDEESVYTDKLKELLKQKQHGGGEVENISTRIPVYPNDDFIAKQ